jgi:hypothetical protein
MKLELVDKAHLVLLLSASSWLGVAATVFGGLAEFKDQLPALVDFIPKGTYGYLSILCAASVPLARIIKQRALREATPQTTAPGEPGAATDGGTPT